MKIKLLMAFLVSVMFVVNLDKNLYIASNSTNSNEEDHPDPVALETGKI
jgi:hypothetical protein